MPPLLNPDNLRVLGRLAAAGSFRASATAWHCRCPCPGHANGDRDASGRVWIEAGRLGVHCFAHPMHHTWPHWAAELERDGIPRSAWFLEPRGRSEPAQPEQVTHTFRYRDESGRELYQVKRTNWKRMWQQREWAPEGDDRTVQLIGLSAGFYVRPSQDALDRRWKFFHERQAPPDRRPTLYAPEARRVLYRLPDILGAAFEEPVFVVEGETKADVLAAAGLVATSCAGGTGQLTPDLLEPLQERPVVVVPDMDDVGYKKACLAAGTAMMVGARSVNVARWLPHEVGPRGDIYDWVATLGSRDVREAVLERFVERGVPGRPESLGRTFIQREV